jgi:N-acetylmuramoyl-L-alanine amidase
MGDRWKRWLLPWYNRKATQITDPVQRLRYLRSTGVNPEQVLAPYQMPWQRIGAGMVLILLAGILFSRMGSSARAVGKASSKGPRPSRQYVLDPLTASEQKVWLVEQKGSQEVYSNGLRIETANTAPHDARLEETVTVDTQRYVTGSAKPAGIVFHTTESHMAAFEEGKNRDLQRVGKWLIDFVASHHYYHYLIDRFGRVHRIVPEDQIANHAGRSVWADGKRTYVDLNSSFLGISLESETQPGVLISDSVTPAQVHALRTLVTMLRLKYGIDESNCVTHAQVSVNPDNFRIGAHTDWASNFPFGEVGLPDNYLKPSPAMLEFGFEYDDTFKFATGARMWKGLETSDRIFAEEASAFGHPVGQHRTELKRRYRAALEAIKAVNAGRDRDMESSEGSGRQGRGQSSEKQ